MKENSGQQAQKRRKRSCIRYLIGFLVLYVTGMTIFEAHFAGSFVPDITVGEDGRTRVRRRPDRQHQRLDPNQPTTREDAILEGFLTLVDIQVSHASLQGRTQYAVMGSFCNIDWKLQQKNPSTVAMFRDLQDQSKMCQGTILKMDLYDITRRAQKYDAAVQNSTTLAQQKVTSFSVPPTGVVFHETRCGSTLTANLLASFSPLHTKVYSESPPPLTALKACDGKNCNKDLHLRLIQDVFYMMGRTTRVERPQFIFYKFQSIGSHHIQTFTKAFPDTPWVFLYRDSIEVMHSHLQGPNSKLIGRGNPVCARAYGREGQPEITKELIEYKGKQVQDVTIPEYCAAHLAGLSESAIREHERTGKGRFVNYNQLPDILWEQVMPQDFKVPITDVMITNMKNVAQVYSKGRGRNANKSWEEDSTRKKQTASTEVVEATHMFMDRPFQRMEGFAAGGR